MRIRQFYGPHNRDQGKPAATPRIVSANAWARGTIVSMDNRVDSAPLVVTVGVAADRAGPAQGRSAECGGKPAVGRAPRGFARDPEPQIRRGSIVEFEQLVARLVLLERQEIALSQDAGVAPGQFATAADLAHLSKDFLHDVERREPNIDGGGGARGDGVDCGPALGKADVDRGAEVIIGEPVQALDLAGERLDRADALGVRGTRVSGARSPPIR